MTTVLGWGIWLLLLYFLSVLSTSFVLGLLLFVFFPVLLLSFAAVCFASRRLSVTFPIEAAGTKGAGIRLSIRAENPGSLPLPRISCRLTGINLLTGEQLREKIDFSLAAKEKRTIECVLSSTHCGRLSLSVEQVRIYDYFGLLFFPKKLSQQLGVTVMPNTFEMALLSPIAKSIPDDSDEYSTVRPGNDPSEIFAVREYRPGDSLRQIHWKLTQKFDQLMTREASLPVDQSVLLLFDTRKPKGKSIPAAQLDAAAEVIATLSQSLLENGLAHRIVWRDAVTGGLSFASVSSTEELTEALGGVLTCRNTDGLSTLDVYRMEKGTPEVSHLFAVCAAVPCEVDDSFEVSSTVLCGCESVQNAPQGSALYFGSETYADDLAALVL